MLVTFILDYDGGTYVSQATIGALSEVPAKLEEAIEWNAAAPGVPRGILKEFLGSLMDDTPSPIEGTEQVWCMTGVLNDKLAVLHFVNTVMVRGEEE